MASTSEMRELLQRAITDSGFRSKLASNPSAAANSMNIKLTGTQATAIKERGSLIKSSGSALDRQVDKAAKLLAIWV